jgi:lipopolysaccharide/colanic/teichoic acid biosynthesis glycosyltransferase
LKQISGEIVVNLYQSHASNGNDPLGKETESLRERDFFNEEAFHRVISRERRRTERSRKPILLMLLDMGDHLASESGEKHVSRLLAALLISTRETDVVGWYKGNRIVGVMFTEICVEGRKTIVSTMISRLSDILRKSPDLEQFSRIGISFHVFPEDWDVDSGKPSNPVFYPDLSKSKDNKRAFGILKRAMDIAGSLLALVVATPLFAAIAIAIKASSQGPVFFRQTRIGQHGKPFVFFKFRSMKVGNDATAHKEYVRRLISGRAERYQSTTDDQGVFKLTADPRITKVGAFLRKTSMDELPQFINVLKGEMSLVGPRPPIPYEVEAYDVWHRRRLLEAKPGITGLWQVSGRSRMTFDEMVRLDLRYGRAWTPWMDVKILLRTPLAVVAGDGAH